MTTLEILPALIFVAAVLYSSVGQGGASGYLAAMAFCGVAPEFIKPSALLLNILVGIIGTVRFYLAGCFSWKIFLPLAIGAAPLAWLGGAIALPGSVYNRVIGAILLFAAYRLFQNDGTFDEANQPQLRPMPLPFALACAAAIGLLSGLTGTGGGIFLAPILLIARWTDARQAAGVTVAFMLINSVAGMAGHLSKAHGLPEGILLWSIAAVVGGLIGTELGSRRLNNLALRRLLSLVLVIAAIKLVLF